MSLKEWAIANGYETEYKRYCDAVHEAEEYCAEQGWPPRGSNFELMLEDIQKDFPELFEDCEE